MKKIFKILCITFLVFSCKQQHTDKGITYSIALDTANTKIAKVKVEFTPKDSLLFMDYGANHLEKRWATFIHNIKAVNKEGQQVTLEQIPNANWKIHAPLNEKLFLTYDVHLNHSDYDWDGGIDGVAYTTDKGVFFTGRTLFIMNGHERENINVNFQLPQGWKVTTPWTKNAVTPNSYLLKNYNELANATIFSGTHKELSIKREDFELIFALGSTDVIKDEITFHNLAEGVLDYYIELMGGIPRPSPEEPFKRVVVVMSSHPSITDGEVIGNNISILIQKDADQFSTTISRFIFAHEFFHLWNGKSFRPNSDDAEWFKEGLTNYYTLKALHRVGFLNDESYLDFLRNFFYARYKDDTGVGTISMANGEEKHEHWGLIYGGGMFAGIAQDIIIRNATNNEKSMDNLMRSLFEKYGNTNDTYTLKELQSSMSELSGIDQTDFFNTHISGTERIPIENYLTMTGLNARIEDGNLLISEIEGQTQKQKVIMNGLFGQLMSER